QELFQLAEAFEQVLRWRRHEGGVARSRAADPVLGLAKLAGFVLAVSSFQQHAVDLFYEPERKWKLFRYLDSVSHRGGVAENLLYVAQRNACGAFYLEQQQVGEARLGSFYLR